MKFRRAVRRLYCSVSRDVCPDVGKDGNKELAS